MREVRSWSAGEIAARVRGGEVSACEVLEAHLERLLEVEPEVGAYLSVDERGARERASELDRRRSAGEDPGPLAGVPVAVKDNLSQEGAPLTCGSRILEGHTAAYTATALARLLGAGAVVVGRTNLDEFAMGSSCETGARGATRNPWRPDRVAGGSSGGSAAAVASGSVPLALGSDTGGSIRQPAAFCGAVGVKPTWGRVSRWGLVAFASSTDVVGPIAREVEDAALALTAIAGPDPCDSTCAARPGEDYREGLAGGVEGLRIGVPRELGMEAMSSGAWHDWQRATARLGSLGADMVAVSIPTLEAAVAVYYVLTSSEASSNLARFDGVRYGRRVDEGDGLAALYAESRSQGFGPEVKRRIMLGTFALSAGYYQAYYGRARGVLETLRRELLTAFEEVDLLVTPTAPTAAFTLGEKLDDPLAMYLSDVFTTPASLAGLPAVAIPSGLDEEGLPLSLQIMAPPFAEGLALRAARAFEADLGFRLEPACLPGDGDGTGAPEGAS